jgi:hypothetical protein
VLRLFTAGAAAMVVWFAAAAISVSPASACIGGTAFDWAVAHEHGGILRATMIGEYGRTGDFTIDMTISATDVLRGDPPRATKVHAALGLACDQQAQVGDAVILVFDVRGGADPYPLPLAYVVEGPAALDAEVVSNALNDLPPTDTATGVALRDTEPPSPIALIPILAGFLTFVIALRPLRQRRA